MLSAFLLFVFRDSQKYLKVAWTFRNNLVNVILHMKKIIPRDSILLFAALETAASQLGRMQLRKSRSR